jgi:hypothetical protein
MSISENNKKIQKPKGKTNNPNGRPKGSPNKITTDIRTWIQSLINNNRELFETDLKAVESKQRLYIMEKLLSFVVPKMQSIEAKTNFDNLTDEQLNTIIDELTKNSEA